jgi:23S rRNA (adenine2503-C2)-methyltransferase
MNLPELTALTASLSEPSSRAAQIFEWLHKKKAITYEEMSNLPASLRKKLSEDFPLDDINIVEKLNSKADDASKYLLRYGNGTIIECVLMRHRHGNTLCVSTQAGCRMGCVFCATAKGGLERNLSAGEICAQVYKIGRDTGERVDSVVLMGCGEPLDNFDNCVRFIELITHPEGANLSARHITLSTCGLTDKINGLAALKLPITLAVSLHAPDDELRARLMPIARKVKIKELIKACAAYADTTHRRVSFEYLLADGVNDSEAHANQLCKILQDLLCHVNLLPLNTVTGNLRPSKRINRFKAIIEQAGIPVTVRHSMGGDVQAACGQLRSRNM